ncbi:MAG TPA: amino acid adenylation domain-containing protein, partial [Thermoanaerobaculia bacterium]|nr:amino acid adenylation domain-containing protein [Thermoanaerobaculia bacterium]
VELPLRAVFEAPTLSGLAPRVEALLAGGRRAEVPPVLPVPRDDGTLPLSFAQERLWFLDRLEPGSSVYNMPGVLALHGALDVAALELALGELVRRHESLRTTFTEAGGEPRQVIAPVLGASLPVVDLSALSAGSREVEAHRLAAAEAARPFDLERGPLLRASLLRLAHEEWLLLVTLHHIVSDGWSMAVLVRETGLLYGAFSRRLPPPLPELAIQYPDFAVWQRQWLSGEVLEAQLFYWRSALVGAPSVLELPTDRPRPAVRSFRGAGCALELPGDVSSGVTALGRRHGATLFMTSLAAFQALLWHYTGQQDLPVGTVVANRTRPEIEGLIGFFVNTLVLRGRLDRLGGGASRFAEVLAAARVTCLEAYAHQDLPFERLVEELKIERSLSHSPLFQVLLVLQNVPDETLELADLTLAPVDSGGGTAKFDLSLTLGESGGRLGASLEYSTDLFDAATARRLLEHFQVLLAAAAADPDRLVRDLPLLTAGERHQLLAEWNDTLPLTGTEISLPEAIANVAERLPDVVSLAAEGTSLSYREMEVWTGRLARWLRRRGVGPESRVGVCLERSPELIMALLAVQKAGGAYVPLDPDYPRERLAYVLEDAAVVLVITESRLLGTLPELEEDRLCRLDREWDALPVLDDGDIPAPVLLPQHPAYLIYTSGSTGRPKGTVVTHGSALNHMRWMVPAMSMGPGQRLLLKTPVSFDASVLEVFVPPMAGATMVTARPDGHRDPSYMVEALQRHEITVVQAVPKLLRAVSMEPRLEDCVALRILLVGGEALERELAETLQARIGCEVWNLYGPTETTVDTTYERLSPGPGTSVPLGRQITGAWLYVLDGELLPVPIGVAAELYIGGAGPARGYLARPELTAERFLPNPWSPIPGDRMYRAGDLVRRLPDGRLDYLGRTDHQVKVRGFRIEPGEIEAALRDSPGVRESVVLVREDIPGDPRLVAYVVTGEGDERPGSEDLRAALRQRLPEYMVPTSIVLLEALPVLPNGKVDRRSLPAPELERATTGGVAPRTPTEELLAGIWADLLGLERVGAGDDFFALGGHSLLGTRMVSRLRDA